MMDYVYILIILLLTYFYVMEKFINAHKSQRIKELRDFIAHCEEENWKGGWIRENTTDKN